MYSSVGGQFWVEGYAKDIAESYKDPQVGFPHPSFILQLPDDVYTGSNLYAFQKSFDGAFQFAPVCFEWPDHTRLQ